MLQRSSKITDDDLARMNCTATDDDDTIVRFLQAYILTRFRSFGAAHGPAVGDHTLKDGSKIRLVGHITQAHKRGAQRTAPAC